MIRSLAHFIEIINFCAAEGNKFSYKTSKIELILIFRCATSMQIYPKTSFHKFLRISIWINKFFFYIQTRHLLGAATFFFNSTFSISRKGILFSPYKEQNQYTAMTTSSPHRWRHPFPRNSKCGFSRPCSPVKAAARRVTDSVAVESTPKLDSFSFSKFRIFLLPTRSIVDLYCARVFFVFVLLLKRLLWKIEEKSEVLLSLLGTDITSCLLCMDWEMVWRFDVLGIQNQEGGYIFFSIVVV